MRKGNLIFNKSDWKILLGLAGQTAAFFLPLLVGWGKIFFDDIGFLFYPQRVFWIRIILKVRSIGERI